MQFLDLNEETLCNQVDVIQEEVRANVLNQPYGGLWWLWLSQYAFSTYPNAHNYYGEFADLVCIPVNSAGRSGRKRPPIPVESGHRAGCPRVLRDLVRTRQRHQGLGRRLCRGHRQADGRAPFQFGARPAGPSGSSARRALAPGSPSARSHRPAGADASGGSRVQDGFLRAA